MNKSFLLMTLIAALLGVCTSCNAQIQCDLFKIHTSLSGHKLFISLITDLPDETRLMVSVDRSLWHDGDSEEYSRSYFSEGGYSKPTTVKRWRKPREVDVSDDIWERSLSEHQSLLAKAAMPYTVREIDSQIKVSFVVPVNQSDPRFGRRNSNLSGTKVEQSGSLRVISDEISLNLPLGMTARDKPSQDPATGSAKPNSSADTPLESKGGSPSRVLDTSVCVDLSLDIAEQIALVAEQQKRDVDLVLKDAIQQYLSQNFVVVPPRSSSADEKIDPTTLSTSLVLDDGTKIDFEFLTDLLWTTSKTNIRLGSSGSDKLQGFISVSVNEESVNYKQPYLKTKSGSTVQVSIETPDLPKSIEGYYANKWSVKVPRTPMDLRISLTVGKKTKFVSIPVRDSGLKNESFNSLVQSHGAADHKRDFSVSSTMGEFVDGVFYNRSFGSPSKSMTHWRYRHMPGLVVCINESKIDRIQSSPITMSVKARTKRYKDKDLENQVEVGFLTSLFETERRLRVLEVTSKAIAVADYIDGEYVKLWINSEDASY